MDSNIGGFNKTARHCEFGRISIQQNDRQVSDGPIRWCLWIGRPIPGYSLWNPWLASGTKVESRGIIYLSQASLALLGKFCLDNVPVWADWQASTVMFTTVGPIQYEIWTGLVLLLMLAVAIVLRDTVSNQCMAFLYASPDNRYPRMKNRQQDTGYRH